MPAQEVRWSGWEAGRAKRLVDQSPHKDKFYEMLEAFRLQANSKEIIKICVWVPANPTMIYIDVKHTGWKHYPCCYRASVAWNADTGELAAPSTGRIRAFARRGWGRFMDDLLGYKVPYWPDCGDREWTHGC